MFRTTVLITGSTSGIGKGLAIAFAKKGCNIVFNGLEEDGEQVARSISDEHKIEYMFSPANMLQPAALRNMVNEAVAKFGQVDVLINNAGVQHVAPIDEFPDEKWDDILAVNLTSAYHLTKAVWQSMKERRFGRIINIASVHGLVASAYKSAYVASKHGLIGLTKALAVEGAEHNITCNAICPGYVLTEMVMKQTSAQAAIHHLSENEVAEKVFLSKHLVKDFVSIDTLASLCVWLADPANGTITGSVIPVDAGWTSV